MVTKNHYYTSDMPDNFLSVAFQKKIYETTSCLLCLCVAVRKRGAFSLRFILLRLRLHKCICSVAFHVIANDGYMFLLWPLALLDPGAQKASTCDDAT